MSKSKSLFGIPTFQKLFVLVIAGSGLIVLFSVLTGNFAPLMTSELEQVGICETNVAVEVTREVQRGRKVLYICGTLVGETKRDIGFDLFYDDRGIYSVTEKLIPGEFWIPIHASRIFQDQLTFPSGQYELRAAYGRDPSIFVIFVVEAGQ